MVHGVRKAAYMRCMLSVGLHMHVEAKGKLKCYVSGAIHLLRVFLIGLKFTKRGWMVSKCPGCTGLYLHSPGVTTEPCHTQCLAHVLPEALVFICSQAITLA